MALFEQQLAEAISTLQAMAVKAADVDRLADLVARAVLAGRTLFTCGNGGSAADALHLAEELVGRYRANRRPLPALCLNADVTALTCIANDFGYEQIFARQLQALARPADLLLVFSTSGNSVNLLEALRTARRLTMFSIALLGNDGGQALALADRSLVVPSANGARVQEVHTLLLHAICERIEELAVE